ncbi:MAG: magnesium chelatase subunit D [Pseudomonadota bacterium]
MSASVSTIELPGLIAAVMAVSGSRMGGVVVQGPASPARDHWLRLLRSLQPVDAPWRRVPVNVSDDRLAGGLDLAATLSSGELRASRGLLAESHRGMLELCMAERQTPFVVSAICAAMDTGFIVLERDGLTERNPGRFGVVAIDESIGEDEALDPRLRDRLGLTWTLRSEGNDGYLSVYDDVDCAAARALIDDIELDQSVISKLTAIAVALQLQSPRPVLQASCAARALAALDQRRVVSDEDVGTAALMTLVMRVPGGLEALQAHEAQPEPPPAPPESAEPASGADKERDQNTPEGELDDLIPDTVSEAAQAVLPPDLLATLAQIAMRQRQRSSGKSGAAQHALQRGRPLAPVAGEPDGRKRLDLLATVKAAAPMQRMRNLDNSLRGGALAVRRDDLRVKRYQQKTRTTTIFVVDASGSAAAQRLAETKGAIELLLSECYVRRDQVALIAFQKEHAELTLPATRSLVRAKRTLAGLPGGGGTPLAAGLTMAITEVQAAQKRGESAQVVLLSDARANVGLNGEHGRERAMQHAFGVADQFNALGVPVLCIDTGRRPSSQCQTLAERLSAQYLPLPFADAATVSAAVQQIL